MKDEHIDRYIMGGMSDDERHSFEQVLITDPELQKEVALHQEIVLSIQMRGAKVYALKEHNRRRRLISSEHLPVLLLPQVSFERRKRVCPQGAQSPTQVDFIRISSYFAIAASLIIGIFVNNAYSDKYVNAGNAIELQELGMRGGSSLDVICQKIKNNEFTEALSLIEEEQSIQYSISDPDAIAQYDAEQQVLEWYKAVTYMRMGKWVKARKLLKQIAESDSFYKKQAQEVLDKL